ncbi:ankyrin repeat domain-containing protein [Aspergillus alliaceus]|uniref:ankyrin repeat domain-containing protein n=1 Tax=Petromyces alliaceus TaxID=209559 RepID=UPI0012A4D58C|nr:uncharacterized protein BDW43DRAFT_315419 [Aspergillus alliaceus]KAB8228920.1 hypothetical protein BDW43DRAFT_315419 [Aspergillus alliaceus]
MSPSNRSYILSNLCPGDSTAERQETLSCERVGTIGSQFLEDKRTQEWITGTGLQILWVHGLAATGKTFISSLVVDHIRSTENRSGIAVFYLSNSHRQHNVADFGVAFGSIARQLLAQIPEWSADVFNLVQKYSSFPPLTRGKSGGLWNLVLSGLASAFIIFDGVNASEVALRDMLVELAGSDAAQHADLHILITSRYPPPRSLLRDYALPTIATRPSDDDLTEYILHELAGKSPEEYFLGVEGDVRNTMPDVIAMMDGVFLPLPRRTSCTVDDLASILSIETPSTKPKVLSKLALACFKKEEPGHHILQVLYLVAKLEKLGYNPTPGQVVDFLPSLGIHKENGNRYATTDMKRICPGYISFSTRTQAMRIRSSLLLTYLCEGASKNNTEERMLQASMSYLSQEEFQSGACSSSTSLKQRFQTRPFLPLAARIISVYTSRNPRPQGILDNFLRFVSCQGSIESYLQAADAWPYQDDATYDELEQAEERWAYFPQGYGPLHVAAHIVGGRVFVEALLQRGEDVAARTANDKTALHIAAGIEDEVETARSLLEHGADVDAVDDSGETPLSIAVVEGNLATVRLLLEYGADLGSLDEDILRECFEERPDVAGYLAGLGVSFPSDEESEEEEV